MPCVSKSSCTRGLIISHHITLFNKLYSVRVQYFDLSIPGIVAYDSCNIFQIFTFFVRFRCHAVPLIYITVFQEDSKRGSVVGTWVGKSVGSKLFILRFFAV